jgi:peptide/nickel transport system permease protein
MAQYLLRRLIFTLFVLFAVSVVMFVSLRLLPGGPLEALLGDQVSGENIAEMERRLGLDKPIPVQYALYLKNILKGDLGRSIKSGSPVIKEILTRFPASLQLAIISMLISSFIGVLVGIISALKPGTLFDYSSMLLALLGRGMPEFWLALLLILFFSIRLGWLPAGGRGSLENLILPVITLAASGTALTARLTRSSMLDVVHSDYVRTARVKGLSELTVVYRHMLKNALIPVITTIGLVFGYALGGSVIVETIFAWPGMGRLIVEAIFQRDYPIVQGAILVYALTFSLVNLFVDITYGYLDPRLRTVGIK